MLNKRVIITTWDEFVQHLRAAYHSPAAKQIASQKLRNHKQRLHERVTAYYTDIIRLCKTIDDRMTDTSKLDHLQQGLKPSLTKEVLRKKPTTPSEFLEYAREEEVLNQLVNANESDYTGQQLDKQVRVQEFTNQPPYNYSSSNVPYQPRYTSPYCYPTPRSPSANRPRSLYYSRYPASRPPTFRCYNCNKTGHYARDCWQPKTAVTETLTDGSASSDLINPSLIFINTFTNGRNVLVLLDTGASQSVISEKTLRTINKKHYYNPSQKLTLGDGKTSLDTHGSIQLNISLQNLTTQIVSSQRISSRTYFGR
ncbi:unnamed protein product [Didymodactylos carnosus]|uniref:CCHC-type domain-containing protein n=1 Tax=Didymodactylos carnosus TaxID=1234261 RepID=A0A815M2N4_9BILA|nr:unnamed protein product [Didymodactylos carnosus]CAF4300838.1 unnamed protein product [Didymodactylos carnosus]